jgi:hypothetical protein
MRPEHTFSQMPNVEERHEGRINVESRPTAFDAVHNVVDVSIPPDPHTRNRYENIERDRVGENDLQHR